jgi:hypothetical protein
MIGCPPGTPDKVFPRGGDGSSLLTPTLLRARLSEHPAGFQDGRRRNAFDSLARPVSPVCQVADKGDLEHDKGQQGVLGAHRLRRNGRLEATITL